MLFVGRIIAVKVYKSYSFNSLRHKKRLRHKRSGHCSCLHQNSRISSHVGGHWFESSSLHQEESLEPQGFEDFSFPRTRKYWAAGLAVICGKIRPFFMPLLQKCCKFFLSFNPLRRNGLGDFSVSIGDYIHLRRGSHLCKEADCCKFATIEQNQDVLKAFRTFSAVCASRERRS